MIYPSGITDANYFQPAFATILVLAEVFGNLRLPYSTLCMAAGKFREMRTLWDQYKRLRNPHVYKVDFSKELYALRHSLLVPGASEPDVPQMQD